MDSDKTFVWFIYVSLALAVVLMIATVLPTEGPSGAGTDGPDGDDVPADGGTDDGTEDNDTVDGDDVTEGPVDGGTDDGGGAASIQNETEDPVTVSGAANDSDDEARENGTRRPVDVEAVETAVIDRINERRRQAYVNALDAIYLDDLWTIAERHTGDMVARNYFALESPDGTTPFRRFNELEPPCTRIDNYHRAYLGIARAGYSPWSNSSLHKGGGTLALELVGNYTDGDDEFVKDVYDDIGIDVQYDADRDVVVSTIAMC